MKGGHNRRHRAVKQAQGTLRKCRENPKAPKVELGHVPEPPRGLDATQRAVWRELAQQVEHLGVFAPSHITAFRLLVEAVAYTRNPDPRDPATARVRTLQVASGLLQRFGLDPASQDRVSTQKPLEDDDKDFLFGPEPELKAIPGGKPS